MFYIYIYREREREIHMYMCVYIYIYRQIERERERELSLSVGPRPSLNGRTFNLQSSLYEGNSQQVDWAYLFQLQMYVCLLFVVLFIICMLSLIIVVIVLSESRLFKCYMRSLLCWLETRLAQITLNNIQTT